MAGSIDFNKIKNDITIWINKANLWIKDVPNKINRLIEKVKNYPIDKQIAVGSIGLGSLLIFVSLILFIL